MCQFFSCVSDGEGKIYYFDWELRQRCLSGDLDYIPDSHTSIADYFGFVGAKEDILNKYEYNPLTQKFTIDQINTTDDSLFVNQQMMLLDFATIIPSLRIKEITNPLKIKAPDINLDIIKLLEQWSSVRDSVGDRVGAIVWDSVWSSVWSSVWAYQASFFLITRWEYAENLGKNPWESCQKLWELGFIPSFDGKTWRLHSGEKADIVYTWTPKKNRK